MDPTRCSQCKRMKTNYSIKPSTGLLFKTCDDCRKHIIREVEDKPFEVKRFKGQNPKDSGELKCIRCKDVKPQSEFKVLKYGAVTKTCLHCLGIEKMYRDSYMMTGSTLPRQTVE